MQLPNIFTDFFRYLMRFTLWKHYLMMIKNNCPIYRLFPIIVQGQLHVNLFDSNYKQLSNVFTGFHCECIRFTLYKHYLTVITSNYQMY